MGQTGKSGSNLGDPFYGVRELDGKPVRTTGPCPRGRVIKAVAAASRVEQKHLTTFHQP